jgi:hypothetical protein
MAKTIRDYLPEKPTVSLVQAKLPKELVAEVEVQKEKDGITWADLMIASFRRYLDESKKKA